MKSRKGIILAGGTGSRLAPLTIGVSKQLLPVYDKPLIYYPISTLMLAGIREMLIVTTPNENAQFRQLLGTGTNWGVSFEFAVQHEPRGLADAFIVGEEFLDGHPSVLILGDNIFFGGGLPGLLRHANESDEATLFVSHVIDPHRFGIAEINADNEILSIEEKPAKPKSNLAITGLYFVDEAAPQYAREIRPSARGELEITSVLEKYRKRGTLKAQIMSRGFAWLDAGTHESLHRAGNFVQTIQERQGLLISSPEEVAYRQGFITLDGFKAACEPIEKSSYGECLLSLIREFGGNGTSRGA